MFSYLLRFVNLVHWWFFFILCTFLLSLFPANALTSLLLLFLSIDAFFFKYLVAYWQIVFCFDSVTLFFRFKIVVFFILFPYCFLLLLFSCTIWFSDSLVFAFIFYFFENMLGIIVETVFLFFSFSYKLLLFVVVQLYPCIVFWVLLFFVALVC